MLGWWKKTGDPKYKIRKAGSSFFDPSSQTEDVRIILLKQKYVRIEKI
jgi:hypothetical protein